jgi:hypothetical protein
MKIAVAIAAALLGVRAVAECTPADPNVIAAAEQRARDAEYKAQQAESIAVRSGNPGAAARAAQARASATAAHDEVEKLQCKVSHRSTDTPQPKTPGGGY